MEKWERPPRLRKSEAERAKDAQEKERKRLRRLGRELKKIGFASIEEFDASADELGRRLNIH